MAKARRKGAVIRPRPPRKQAKNLTLDAEAVKKGETYSRKHRTNLSRLVGDLLKALPTDVASTDLSPAVRRLRGVAEGAGTGAEAHREHLRRKYGGS